jgi:nicotinamidase-related amidase
MSLGALQAETSPIVVPSLRDLVRPARAAVLIVDVQAHFADDDGVVLGALDVIARLKRLAAEAKRVGVTRIYVRATESDETDTPVWISRHATKPERIGKYRKESPGAQFHPDLTPSSGDVAIEKHRYSAFLGTDLDRVLRSRGIDTVVVTGIMSNVCVELTAADAFQRDYWTIVLSDCTTTRTEIEQRQAMLDVERNWGRVVVSDAVLAEWQALPSETTT